MCELKFLLIFGQFSADDKDCTPWAPTCSPLGYCRGSPEEWDWDGSFGSPTNPKPGGEQSDWIKQNAASGGARNEDYYKKIEDDNRAAHVKFRKENPIFYEQIPELLPRLESIEKNVYNNCTYCEYDPKSDGKYQELVTRLSGNRRQNGGNGKGNGGKSQPRNNRRVSNNSNNRRNNSNNRRNNSNNRRNNANNQRKNATNQRKNSNSQRNNSNNRRNNSNNRKTTGNNNRGSSQQNSRCPETLQKCKSVCGSFSGAIKKACESNCTKRCS